MKSFERRDGEITITIKIMIKIGIGIRRRECEFTLA